MTNLYDENFVSANEVDVPEKIESKLGDTLYRLYVDSLVSDASEKQVSNHLELS